MIIKEMILKNFRQFKGVNRLEFANDTDRNITLILGENTSGKSTILQAFLWCFYEETNFSSPQSIRNEKVSQDEEVYVEISLIHSSKEYIVKREIVSKIQSRRLKTALKVTRRDDTNTYHLNNLEAADLINKILPQDLAPYFFYDTERFNTLTSKRNLKKSVKTILGLTPLENMIDYLGHKNDSRSVIGQFYRELDLEHDDKLKLLLERRDELEELLKMEENKLKNYDENIKENEESLNRIRFQLKGKDSVSSLEKDRQQKEKELANLKSVIKKMENETVDIYKKNSYKFFMKYLAFENKNKLEGVTVELPTHPNVSDKLINQIIEDSKCICGTSIDEDRERYLKELLNEVKVQLDVTQLDLFKRNNDKYSDKLFMNLLKNNHKLIYSHIDEMHKYENDIEVLGEKIERDKDAKSLEIEKNRIEEVLKTQKSMKDNSLKSFGAYDKELTEKNNEIAKKKKVSSKNEEIENYISYADEVLKWVKETLIKRESYITEELNQKVNTYFKNMYHGNRAIEIDNEYIVTLFNVDSNTGEKIYSDESKGLETVKNFAFISALIDLAKSKIIGTPSDEMYEPESYPLTLDAPFSNADETHVKNISNTLPEVTEQLIMIVMEKDWKYAQNGIEDKIGKKYCLNKVDELETILEEG